MKNIDIQGQEEDPTESDDLLYSLTYGVREFYLAGSWTDIILGVMLEETKDSFLIAMPARILKQDNMVIAEEIISNAPYVRFLKTDFRAVSFSMGINEEAYLVFIRNHSPDTFPDLLDIIGEEQGKYSHEEVEEIADEILEEKSSSQQMQSSKGATLVNGNLTELELKEKVEKAITEGRFIPPQGKLPN